VSGATANTIGGVVSAEFNTIYLNGGNGLRLDGSSANEVIGNHIGTDDTVTYSMGNITGILLTHGAANNLVHDNIIRFNSNLGVHITGAGSDSNQVYTNTIRNQGNTGVQIDGGARFNRIGSPAGGPTMLGNLISGNAREGIYIAGSDTSQNLVYGNKIGTTANGAGDDGNGLNGVVITNDAHHNQVGRSIAERNLISGNGQSGVRIDLGAHDNSVGANYIGLNAAGTAAIPNSAAGVAVIGANRNGIGSSLVNATQFISGNTREGIYVESAANTMIGQTNQIGVAGNATAPLGNGMQGVMLVDATSTWVAARTIANNGGAGVAVTGASASDNKLMPLAIYGNAGLPVDLGNDGPTANDSGDADSGPNTLLNYPQVTSVSGATINGSACPGCQVYMYAAIGNPAAPGGGGALLDISPPTADASGGWSATLPAGTQLAQLTLVACQAPCFFTGNTSELRPRPQMFVPVVRR
jgi:parallel beta-helix repeat protein